MVREGIPLFLRDLTYTVFRIPILGTSTYGLADTDLRLGLYRTAFIAPWYHEKLVTQTALGKTNSSC